MKLLKIMRSAITTRLRKTVSGPPKDGNVIQTSKLEDSNIWKVWDPLLEDWYEWPESRPLPIARPLEYLHTKRVGRQLLHVYRDIDGIFVGEFCDERE